MKTVVADITTAFRDAVNQFRTPPPKTARRKSNRARPATTTKRKPGRAQRVSPVWHKLPASWFK